MPPLRSPDQANPLLNVISQTDPEGFQSDFAQPAQAELAQPDFLFDPGVGEFGNPGSLFINRRASGVCILALKAATAGASSERTIERPLRPWDNTGISMDTPDSRPVELDNGSVWSGPFFLDLRRAAFSSRTAATVAGRIIDKGAGKKLRTHPRRLNPAWLLAE